MSKYNIQRSKTTLTLAYANNATTIVSTAVPFNGLLSGIIVTVPDLDSTNTATVTVKDADGNTVYTKASLAKSTTTTAFIDSNNYALRLPMAGNHTITIVTSGSQTADRVFNVVLLVNRGN